MTTVAGLARGMVRCAHNRVIRWDDLEITCPQCEDEVRAAATMGFIGPLPEVDQDRCPACGLDPLDLSLHAPSCPLILAGLCGVIHLGRICLRPDEFLDGRWVLHEHEYVALEEVP